MGDAPDRIWAVQGLEGIISFNDYDNGEQEYVRADHITSLQKRIEVLEGALGPLAAMLKPHHDHLTDETPIFGIEDSVVTVGDFRCARAALQEE